jgi:hypothetical protein
MLHQDISQAVAATVISHTARRGSDVEKIRACGTLCSIGPQSYKMWPDSAQKHSMSRMHPGNTYLCPLINILKSKLVC